jgi:hypothetical protein
MSHFKIGQSQVEGLIIKYLSIFDRTALAFGAVNPAKLRGDV